ncbi:plasmid partitioning protein RepA [Methylobacterium nodulans]|uniref:Plasmid partitioning protein RepA n=1 Tax=Methylobacterium nodulans (strain LMG 21967 / CNCM I-2342 / ORS 2060) TaxID=460265 RepID=B8IRA3_METNO|nr:plasmid partitioning protein RepA [Methylobacterium nodulans]ACL58643.1 plasmid partitioning protein RepA [Methylobacterium nodulans ORS 2060]
MPTVAAESLDFVNREPGLAMDEVIAGDAKALSMQLQALRAKLFPPQARKQLRRFSSGEAARLIGVTDSYLRHLALGGEGPEPEKNAAGRRAYSLEQIHEIRRVLAKAKPGYLPVRQPGEPLQVIAVTNFKGGSGKTTTAAHLAQYFALRGYRVLAVDLDPQASLSALFGYQPEFDVADNETLYGAIRYDDARRPLSEIIRPTYFAGLDLVPGNLELHEFEHDTPRMLADKRDEGDALFFARVAGALATVEADYDLVVIDCPPQLGFLTLSALCAATSVLITIHPQMLDLASMNQFLSMTADLLAVVREAGGNLSYSWLRYVVTRYEPNDGPQTQIVAFLRGLFAERVLTSVMVKSTAVSDAGLSKQTLYEAGRETMNRNTYDRAIESLDAVNREIETLVRQAWGRAVA